MSKPICHSVTEKIADANVGAAECATAPARLLWSNRAYQETLFSCQARQYPEIQPETSSFGKRLRRRSCGSAQSERHVQDTAKNTACSALQFWPTERAHSAPPHWGQTAGSTIRQNTATLPSAATVSIVSGGCQIEWASKFLEIDGRSD